MATIAKEAREAHAARREAVGKPFEPLSFNAATTEEEINQAWPRSQADLRALPAFSPKNFDNNPYLELRAQPPPTERIAA
jgi:hypothetical protein